MAANPKPLLVIVGETATGKSAAAIELAKKIDGEIICADSRTVYKHMDIGTAKPSFTDRQDIPHHLLDIIEPDQPFTVAEFQKLANQTIADIYSRGKVPIVVGGSGMYIDSLLFNYQFSSMGAKRDDQNPRHLKVSNNLDYTKSPRANTLVFGIQIPREQLKQRITNRVDEMLGNGLLKEVKMLSEKYGWQTPALRAPGYKAFREYIDGTIDLDQAKALFIKNDLQLAKKQRTWFKRNKRIQWIDDPRKIVDIATTQLNKLP